MTRSRALLMAAGTFVVCLGLAVALFAALDIELLFLVGPVIAMGIAAHSVYTTAMRDVQR